MADKKCTCSNEEFYFNCTCDWVEKNPGTIAYCCVDCGIYVAGKPLCSRCEGIDTEGNVVEK